MNPPEPPQQREMSGEAPSVAESSTPEAPKDGPEVLLNKQDKATAGRDGSGLTGKQEENGNSSGTKLDRLLELLPPPPALSFSSSDDEEISGGKRDEWSLNHGMAVQMEDDAVSAMSDADMGSPLDYAGIFYDLFSDEEEFGNDRISDFFMDVHSAVHSSEPTVWSDPESSTAKLQPIPSEETKSAQRESRKQVEEHVAVIEDCNVEATVKESVSAESLAAPPAKEASSEQLVIPKPIQKPVQVLTTAGSEIPLNLKRLEPPFDTVDTSDAVSVLSDSELASCSRQTDASAPAMPSVPDQAKPRDESKKQTQCFGLVCDFPPHPDVVSKSCRGTESHCLHPDGALLLADPCYLNPDDDDEKRSQDKSHDGCAVAPSKISYKSAKRTVTSAWLGYRMEISGMSDTDVVDYTQRAEMKPGNTSVPTYATTMARVHLMSGPRDIPFDVWDTSDAVSVVSEAEASSCDIRFPQTETAVLLATVDTSALPLAERLNKETLRLDSACDSLLNDLPNRCRETSGLKPTPEGSPLLPGSYGASSGTVDRNAHGGSSGHGETAQSELQGESGCSTTKNAEATHEGERFDPPEAEDRCCDELSELSLNPVPDCTTQAGQIPWYLLRLETPFDTVDPSDAVSVLSDSEAASFDTGFPEYEVLATHSEAVSSQGKTANDANKDTLGFGLAPRVKGGTTGREEQATAGACKARGCPSNQSPITRDSDRDLLQRSAHSSLKGHRLTFESSLKCLLDTRGVQRHDVDPTGSAPPCNNTERNQDQGDGDQSRDPLTEGQTTTRVSDLCKYLVEKSSHVPTMSGGPEGDVSDTTPLTGDLEPKFSGRVLFQSFSSSFTKVLGMVMSVRSLMLFIFCLCSLVNAFQWMEYTIISSLVSRHYGVAQSLVAWTSTLYLFAYTALAIPATCVLDCAGLDITVTLGALGTCIGAWVKAVAVAPEYFSLVLLGQSIPAMSQAFILSVPPRLDSPWSEYRDLRTACKFGVLGNQLGIALGFIVPPRVVHPTFIEKGLDHLCLGVALVSTTALLAMLITFRSRPVLSSNSEVVHVLSARKVSFKNAFCQLLTDGSFISLSVSYGINTGAFYAICTSLNPVVSDYFPGEDSFAGLLGVFLIASGLIGYWVCAAVAERTGKPKGIALATYAMSAVGMLTYTFVLASESHILLVATCCALGFSTAGHLPIGMQLAAEITYPVPKGVSATILNVMAQVLGLIFIIIFSPIHDKFGDRVSNLGLAISLLVGTILTSLVRRKLKSQEARTRHVRRRASESVLPFTEGSHHEHPAGGQLLESHPV